MAESPPKGKAMRKVLNKKSGFTLIELMIVVAILGILAAIAIPAFVTYVRRSKSSEAVTQVDQMFKLAASYYNPSEKQNASGIDRSQMVHCTVANDTQSGGAPGSTKLQRAPESATSGFNPTTGLNFGSGFTYYQYSLTSLNGDSCSNLPGQTANGQEFYFMRAFGDLDGDTVTSLFEQAATSNLNNELFRSRGFYVINETE
jgi:type IV pilus assembly protein PilA